MPGTELEMEAARRTIVPTRIVVVFACTTFLSAALLFQVQLIISKYILPWFGGSAAVWTTSLLVFQLLLLGGYLYSHLISERLSRRAQSNLHLGILATACGLIAWLSLRWPSAITPGANWEPQSTAAPILHLVAILLISTGLPFFVLSTTGPLLQRWFSDQGGDARTYRLYAVSNVGSLLGLLTFPFLLEPMLPMTTQGRLWAVLFLAFAGGCAWCAWMGRNSSREVPHENPSVFSNAVEATSAVRVLWLLLPACASALLLATTNLLCQQITSVPLLWVLPLALYLLSFIFCFDHPRWYRREIFQPLCVLGTLTFWASTQFRMMSAEIVVLPILLFAACMVCHGELTRLKPAPRLLTLFYLFVSIGGALGGIFVAILAPQLFETFTEFQLSVGACLALALGCLLRDRSSWIYRMGFRLSALTAGGFVAAAFVAGLWAPELERYLIRVKFYPLALLGSAVVLVGTFLERTPKPLERRSFRIGQTLVVVLIALCFGGLYKTLATNASFVLAKRNFYGSLRVFNLPQGGRALYHGQTLHGAQLNPPNDRLPTAYYGPESGIGILLRNLPRSHYPHDDLRVGVVGLGAGTLAAYGLPGDYIRYYEINPDVVALSSGKHAVFTYIRDSRAKVDVELGDARLLLQREWDRGQRQNFDVLVLDAFSGDAIPVHLLTAQAFDLYWNQVNSADGIIAVHASSSHIDLLPVLRGIAERDHARMLVRAQVANFPYMPNVWVFLARNPRALDVAGLFPVQPALGKRPPRVWTDNYSDIISLIY